jgi:hypothetical protein
VDAAIAVGALDLADQSSEPLAAQLRSGRILLVFVVVLTADAKDFAAAVYRSPGVDESVDNRLQPFGRGLTSARNVALWRSTAGSRTRRRAACSSVDLLDGASGRALRTRSSCLTHLDGLTSLKPILNSATDPGWWA